METTEREREWNKKITFSFDSNFLENIFFYLFDHYDFFLPQNPTISLDYAKWKQDQLKLSSCVPPFESTLLGHNKGLRFSVWPDLDARENARERLCLVLVLLVYVVYFNQLSGAARTRKLVETFLGTNLACKGKYSSTLRGRLWARARASSNDFSLVRP